MQNLGQICKDSINPAIYNSLNTKGRKVDFMWDCHNLTSLKQSTRKRCGHGDCKRITAKAIVPQNWQSFLHSNDYKRELFTFLAVHVESTNIEGKL